LRSDCHLERIHFQLDIMEAEMVRPFQQTTLKDRTPLARILAHESAYWRCIAQSEQRDGWRAFSNPQLIPRVDPNHAGEFRGEMGAGPRIAAEVVNYYRGRGATPAAYVDCLAPPDLIPSLHAAGFVEWTGATSDIMLYIGPDQARPVEVEVELVENAAGRAAWASIMEETVEAQQRELLTALYTLEISDPRMRPYLVRVDAEPACRCELFSSDGLGRIEAVRTAERYQRRGLAAAAIRHALADSYELGNQSTYLYAEPGGDAQRLYHRLGFRTVAERAVRSFVWEG
jgi:GNAT superfamily N-acetyltransferase